METCPHTHIVGLALLGDQYASGKDAPPSDPDEDEYKDQIDVAGKDTRSAKAEWKDGDKGKGEGEGEEGDGRAAFTGKVLHLLKVMGVVKFPINPYPHLSKDARSWVLERGTLLSCHESVCSACGEDLLVTEHKDAVAVPQVRFPRTTAPVLVVFISPG